MKPGGQLWAFSTNRGSRVLAEGPYLQALAASLFSAPSVCPWGPE